MTRSDGLRIADILDAADQLATLVARGREAYLRDPLLRRAAERLVEIIGEAATAMSDEAAEAFEGVVWRDIRRLRIVLAHHYHRVDPELLWTIVIVDVPDLAVQLRRP